MSESADEPDTAESRWLGAQQQCDWRATITGMTYLMRTLSADLEVQTGLSLAEYELLVRLSESRSDGVRMAELADRVAHSRSRVTHTVARLECAGLVQRIPAREDRRGVIARITDAGMARLADAAPLHVESVRARLVDVVTPEQLRAIGDAMRSALTAAGLTVPGVERG